MSKDSLEKKISSLQSTYKIVRVTELSTLAKLAKLRQKAEQAVIYYESILSNLHDMRNTTNFMQEQSEEKNIVVLVITSNRGLCGSYNSNVFGQIDQLLSQLKEHQRVVFYVVGERGKEYLQRKKQEIKEYLNISLESITMSEADYITYRLLQQIDDHQIDSLYVIFTKYINAVHSEAQCQKVFPIINDSNEKGTEVDFLLDYEESDEDIERLLMTNYMSGLLYSMFLYSVASENCIRRIVMKEARDNLENQLKEAVYDKKKIEQQTQTNELLDIINGSKAIRKE